MENKEKLSNQDLEKSSGGARYFHDLAQGWRATYADEDPNSNLTCEKIGTTVRNFLRLNDRGYALLMPKLKAGLSALAPDIKFFVVSVTAWSNGDLDVSVTPGALFPVN